MKYFICNDVSTFKTVSTDKLIVDEVAYQTATWQTTDTIFLMAELEWNKHELNDGYGLHLLKDLRVLQKVTCPIILCSFLPLPILNQWDSKIEALITKTPGHYFYQLPIDWDAIAKETFKGIDGNTLNDINNHFFSLEGIIDEEFHALKNKIHQKENTSQETVFKQVLGHVEQAFQRIEISLDLDEPQMLKNIFDRLTQDLKNTIINQKDTDGSIITINNYIGEIKRLLPPDELHPIDLLLEQRPPWKVLFVDDEVAIAQRVQELFEERNITCDIVHNAADTYQKLEADTNNDYCVLICDYRMLNEDETWQEVQGYNILEYVFVELPNQLALFSLTSFNKRTLLRVQQLHKMQVWSYSKDDVIGKSKTVTGFNLFAEKVLEEGNKCFDLKRQQPKATSWVKGYSKKFDQALSVYYKQHRLAKDFVLANDFLERQATEIFNQIKTAKHNGRPSGHLNIPSVQENIGKDKKNPQTAEEKLERFREILLGRRIAISLKHWLEMDKWQIFNTMKRNYFTEKYPSESDNAVNQYFTTYMALSLDKDIPKNLLPEEQYWLDNLMNDAK